MRSSLLLGSLLVLTLACSGTGSFTGDGGLGEGGSDGATEPVADGSTIPQDGGVDGAAPAEPVNGLYFGACLTTLAGGRVDRVLRFYTEVKYTPPVSAAQATLELKLTALKLGAGGGPPPTVSKSETVGQSYTVPKGPVAASGVYAGPLGTITVPGAANPISGRDVVIEQTNVPGRFAPARFCSQLGGHVVAPADALLEGGSNTCIYLPVKEGDPTPALQLSDFPATCTLN
ncbi:MAG TPA: hypothetical protein VLT33_04140 [Labilithrix sp.]|nr:hypothetical protein [Labilithrix sp.]